MLSIENYNKNLFKRQVSYIYDFNVFLIALIEYSAHKIDQIIILIQLLTFKNVELFFTIKFNTLAKLIWSRGKLSRQIRFVFIFFFTLSVYLSGSVFQKSLTIDKEASQIAYLSTLNGFFLGRIDLATKQGRTVVLSSPVDHEVKPGETLDSIGKFYGISVETIKYANNIVSNAVSSGQVLKIPRVEGTIHQVKSGDTIASLAKRYNVPEQSIVDFNYIDEPYLLSDGQVITIPDAKQQKIERIFVGRENYDTSAYGIIPYAAKGPTGTGKFAWPFSGILTQGFGQFHPGIDIASPTGNITAADKGVVIRAGWWQGGFGNAVQIDHRNGLVTSYAHMSSIVVTVNQEVDKGQQIGVVGSTGRSTGSHLHFSVQENGKYINPLSMLYR